jgi:hypothetical protein
MIPDNLFIFALVVALAIVQSIFGMGILVIGTPTLLLLGYDFLTSLCYLLPASFVISLIQVATAGKNRVSIPSYLYLYCLPGIGVGLYITKSEWIDMRLNILIGVMLIISALVRLKPPSQKLLRNTLKKYALAYHLIMGLVHGLTNLGGALLAILSSGTASKKESIRYVIAYYYLAFTGIQLLLITIFLEELDILISNFFTPIVAAVVYFLIGQRMFIHTSSSTYNKIFTLLLAAYGCIILVNF